MPPSSERKGFLARRHRWRRSYCEVELKKVIVAVFAMLLTVVLCLMATGAIRSFLVMAQTTQWLIFLGMASVTVVLWICLLVAWHRRAAAH